VLIFQAQIELSITMTEILYTLVMVQITIVAVTLYLHRSQAHRSLEFHPLLGHFFRFWLWLTTGMVTKQWVAIHRKHHRFTEQEGDPHSPHVYGIGQVVFKGAGLYHTASKDSQMVEQYGAGTPNDWIEQHLYTPHSRAGIMLMLLINVALFGAWGLLVWGIQMLWIPLWAAGFINGIGHWWGYRNGETRDSSRNILPWAIWVGGEELHNNHHLEPANPKLSRKWFEFDIGWMWFKIFEFVKLAKVR
jgi:stearoyl-CoA desaturase (delta-9 desaturase)